MKAVLQVKVKPLSRVSRLSQDAQGTWLAEVKAPPVDGKANEEMIRLVAEHFACRRDAVTIAAGASGRKKLVRVETD
jgi:uncharacterized protein (TIGR00251 family)